MCMSELAVVASAHRPRTTINLDLVSVRPSGREATGVRAEARRSVHPLKVAWIALGDIDETPPELNSRQVYDEVSINELAASVREHGILQPVCVRPIGERYLLVYGMRRLKAAIRAGLQEVPCTIQVADDDRAFLLNTIENLHRHQLSGVERVRAIERLAATNLGVRDISRRTGFNPATISRWMKIDRHPALKDALEREAVELGQAMELTRAPAEALADLLEQAPSLGRAALRERVEELRVLCCTTPPASRPDRDRELIQHARAVRTLLAQGAADEISSAARRELDRLYGHLVLLRGT